MLSTHRVEVVPVVLEPHPNADSLSVVRVFGYTVCVRTEDWKGVELGAYIPPDSVVPDTPQFAFLGDHKRIKVKRLRGIISMGLLVPAPAGAELGDDVAGVLGVTHYDPPEPIQTGGEAGPAPKGYRPVFDVESFRRYAAAVFEPGELVFVTEKIHGANARFCCYDGEIYCGSRTEWKRRDESNLWWRALAATPGLEDFCRYHPELTVYGEVFGQVQDLKYGSKPGELRIAVFDLLYQDGTWLNPAYARIVGQSLPWVPTVASDCLFDVENLLSLAEGQSLIEGAGHVREGIVVKPIQERQHPMVGRVCLKIVGSGYLEKA